MAQTARSEGNEAFKRGDHAGAIILYGKAITLDPTDPRPFQNRAICHLARDENEDAARDAARAFELDGSNPKPLFLQARALHNLRRLKEAARLLWRATELCRAGKHSAYIEPVRELSNTIKRELWRAHEDARTIQKSGLHEELIGVLKGQAEEQARDLRRACAEEAASQVEAILSRRLAQLNDLFERADRAEYARRELPDAFCCTISFELMTNPVITPSGRSYERSTIEEHLRTVGTFDPVTRKPMTTEDLVPNLALKEAIEAFRNENPWADGEGLED